MSNLIQRDKYLQKLYAYRDFNLIKVIVGLRRSGKSTLLKNLFYFKLINEGVKKENIIYFSFFSSSSKLGSKAYTSKRKIKNDAFEKYLDKEINEIKNNDKIFIFLDEIQELENFHSTLEKYVGNSRYSVYVTGSNSNLLVDNVPKKFGGRAKVIKVYPLTFSEWVSNKKDFEKNKEKYLGEYLAYGGLPELTNVQNDSNDYSHEEIKKDYLVQLLHTTYIKDLFNIYRLDEEEKEQCLLFLKFLAQTAGKDFNYNSLQKAYNEKIKTKLITRSRLQNYLNYFEQAYLIKRVYRHGLKGKKLLDERKSPFKIYFEDNGLMNAINDFQFSSNGGTFENTVFNQLRFVYNSVSFDKIGSDNIAEENKLEVDFVVNNIGYFQVSWFLHSDEKLFNETKVFNEINTIWKKILITNRISEKVSIYKSESYQLIDIFPFLMKTEEVVGKDNHDFAERFLK
ncbi:MAG: ATP-binding protein [Mycoplasma sp.]